METNTTRKQSKENIHQNYNIVKLSPPTSMVPYRSASKVNQSETTLKYFDPLRTHKYHTHTHTPCLVEIILFIVINRNCQGLRPKWKELQNYLLENQTDILALNETFLKPKFKFHLPGNDIYKNDRLVGTKGDIAILVKKGIIVNQEWKDEHFNVITDNEALAIEIELQDGIRLFWLKFIAQMEILVQGYSG